MIDPATLNLVRKGEDLCYSLYSSPIGGIYILGNDAALKALIFKGSYPGKSAIGKHFAEAESGSVRTAKAFLDHYFHGPGRRGSGASLRSQVKYSLKDSMLFVIFTSAELKLDMSTFTGNEIGVYRELMKVPAGSTVSYGQLARRSGIPDGARFVGNAMAKNNFPIIIPCHRVIKSDGSMGNYSVGIHIKKYLLDHEKKF
ncbi:MAG TPA: MGMT family protein [Spirochaetota bacterium]|nr:MGMT family protein [Spirochaetota bacterium]HPC39386.1 MGMT family protein [Spirochaetota bacterium]HPL16873.1 MGMT family protein [Spirochaetota bacterium]HQF06723.1 MGMT family protein [Spirochaetota bacterium]HQH95658.1 MGMT family protein [Spirochaetota bacterium]